MITDGAPNFYEAYTKEFWTQKKDTRTEHIRHIRLAGDRNNNRMERYHGTFKERSKVMRAIKKPDSAFIQGQRVYYNYLRPHTAFDGKTPAQTASIDLGLQGKQMGSDNKESTSEESVMSSLGG